MNQPESQSNPSKVTTAFGVEMLLRVVLGGVLIAAGGLKLFAMPAMAESIINYQVMPEAYVNIVAIILPPMEVVVGVCLIAGLFYRGAMLITISLFVVFLVSVAYAMSQGYDIDCGCFGTANVTKVGLLALGRNTLLLIGAILLWVLNSSRCQVDNWWLNKSVQPIPKSSPQV